MNPTMHSCCRNLKSLLGIVTLLAAGACGGGSSPPPPPPVLTATTLKTPENAPVTQMLTARDPNGAAVTFSLAGNPAHGMANITATGSLTYKPSAYFYGSDSIPVTLTDSAGGRGAGTVAVNVTYVNYPPVAHNDQLRVPSAQSTLSILANDENPNHDVLTVTILAQPQGGTVSVQNKSTVSFQPQNAFAGPTSFTYRVTNPSGSSSDATVQLVVGDFPGIVFLADNNVAGSPELQYFDGFQTIRVNSAVPAGATIRSFTLAPDGVHAAYVSASVTDSQVWLATISTANSGQLIYTGGQPVNGFLPQVLLNRDASYALITDPAAGTNLETFLVKTATAASTAVGRSNSNLSTQFGVLFNPTSSEFYVQAQVGGSAPPMSGTGYTTLFSGTETKPDPLVQIGASYGVNDGTGSGNLMRATPDGSSIVHAAVSYPAGPGSTTWDLLVNNRASNTETYLYRKFGVSELAVFGSLSFDINGDGSAVCFALNSLPANASLGAGRIWVSDPRAPGSATAITPQADYTFGCQWASDGKSLVYQSSTGSAPVEAWVANATKPGTVSRLIAPQTAAFSYLGLAKKTTRAVVGVGASTGNSTVYYIAAVDAPGTGTPFYTDSSVLNSGEALDANGTSMQMMTGMSVANPRVFNQLHWISTRVSNCDLVISQGGQLGVLQSAFVPE